MDSENFEELKENFDHFDRDGNGRIDFGEFRELMDALTADLTEQQARVGFDSVDKDGSGRINFVEFCDWWSSK